MLKVLCSPGASRGHFLWMFSRKPGSKSPKETQQKALCCVISKGLKFGREGILFSSELHNGAFTEPLWKGIATAFVLKGVSFGRVCWCRQTGWWLTKVIRLWNLASSLRWYVFCVWKDDSQETKAFWRSPLQDTPKSGPGTSWSNQYSAGTNGPAYQSWNKRTFGDLGEWHLRRRKVLLFGKKWKQLILCWEE